MLAVCAGGLRRYLDGHAELPRAELSAIVPLGIGEEHAGSAPSRRIGLGTHIADAAERLAWIHAQTSAPAAATAPALTPPCCTITHVPGPAGPVYLHGARMSYFSAILPIADGLERPAYVVWELTLACDQPCTHCGSRAGEARADELTRDEALRVVADLAALGAEEVAALRKRVVALESGRIVRDEVGGYHRDYA